MEPLPWQRVARAEAAAHAKLGGVQAFGPLVATFAGPGLPLNTAWHDGSRPPTADELAAFEAFSRAHRETPTLHLLSPAAPALLPLLNAHGYQLETVLHLYAHRLRELPDISLSVQEAHDPEAWAELSGRGFGAGSVQTMRLVARAPGARLFTALLDGEPAGGGALSVEGDVGALYGMSTLPGHRRRGVQQALIAARLHAAARAGATLATVFAGPDTGSERNVRRAGFVLGGARLTFSQRLT